MGHKGGVWGWGSQCVTKEVCLGGRGFWWATKEVCVQGEGGGYKGAIITKFVSRVPCVRRTCVQCVSTSTTSHCTLTPSIVEEDRSSPQPGESSMAVCSLPSHASWSPSIWWKSRYGMVICCVDTRLDLTLVLTSLTDTRLGQSSMCTHQAWSVQYVYTPGLTMMLESGRHQV